MTSLSVPEDTNTFAPHPTTNLSRRAVFGAFWSLLHTLLPSVSAALIFFVSAAYLSPSDFGHLAMAVGVVSVALALSPMAFGEALVQRARLESHHADAVFWLTAFFAVAYVVTLTLLASTFASWLAAPELEWLIPVLAFKVPFELLASVPSAMIVRSMQFRLVALRTAIGSGVGAVLCIALLMNGFGLLALAVSQIAVSVVVCGVAFWASGWRPGFSFSGRALKELTHYGVFASGQRMIGTVRLDHLVAGALAGASILGLLVFAQRLFRLLADVASGAVSSVLHVVLASMQGQRDRVLNAFGIATFGAAVLGFPIFIGAALVIDDLIALFFADRWSDAASSAQIYCAAGLVATLSVVQGALIRSQGKPDWLFWYQLSQEVTTVLLIALTWRFGLEVMVTSIVVKTFVLWPITVRMTLGVLGCSLRDYMSSFVGPLCAALGMAFVILMLPARGDLAGLLLQIAVGAAVYPAFLLLFSKSRLSEAWMLMRLKGALSP